MQITICLAFSNCHLRPNKVLSIQHNQIIVMNGVNLATATTHNIGEESPTAEAKRKAEATTSKTKGKWLKITRKGLLVSAIGRVGKHSG